MLALLALPAIAGVVKIERVSPPSLDLEVNLASGGPAISADGRFVAFATGSIDERREIFVRDRQTGKTEPVSVAADGVPANGSSRYPAISADGRFIAFVSYGDNLVSGDTNNAQDIFVRDRQTGMTELASVGADGAPANEYCYSPSISGDGRFVAFWSAASNLVPGDTDQTIDVFVRDRQTGKTECMSVAANGTPVGPSWSPAISADGRFVAFVSYADNLAPGETTDTPDVFVRDRERGTTEFVGPYFESFQSPAISADGRFVAFMSYASDLVPGDTNRERDVFVRDRQAGTTGCVSVAANGTPVGSSYSPAISADGRFVAFASYASNLVPGDTNNRNDIFVRDRQTRKTELVSVSVNGGPANGDSYSPSVSADGRFVALVSDATDLVPGDTNGRTDVFVAERQ